MQVLAYAKFGLSSDERQELLSDYLPFCKVMEAAKKCPTICRDPKDQPFLDLAESGKAELLVSGDRHLLSLAGQTIFHIVTPETYRQESQDERESE